VEIFVDNSGCNVVGMCFAMWLECVVQCALQCVFAMGLQCGKNVFCNGFLQCGWNVFLQCTFKKRQPYVFGQVFFFQVGGLAIFHKKF